MQSHLQRGGRRLSQNSTPGFFDPPQGDPAPSGTPQNLLSKRGERKTPLSLPFAKSSGAFSHILSSLLNFLFAEFFGQCLDLFYVLFLHSGHYFYIILCPGDIFALLKHALHHFCCGRCPASVFDQTDGAVLEAALCQTVDEILHERVNACIVGQGCENQLTVTESIRYGSRHIVSCQIVNNDLRAAFFFQLICKQFGSFFGIAVNRSIGNHNALFFWTIRRPDIVFSM